MKAGGIAKSLMGLPPLSEKELKKHLATSDIRLYQKEIKLKFADVKEIRTDCAKQGQLSQIQTGLSVSGSSSFEQTATDPLESMNSQNELS